MAAHTLALQPFIFVYSRTVIMVPTGYESRAAGMELVPGAIRSNEIMSDSAACQSAVVEPVSGASPAGCQSAL